MARKKTRPLIEDFDFIPAESLVPENEQPYTIPRHWKWVRLGSLVQVVRGVTYKKHQVVDPSSSEAVLIVRGGNITDGHVCETQSDVFVSSTLVNDEQILQKNDLVVVASSGSKLAVGKAGVFEGAAFPCAAGGFTFLVRAAQYLRPEFLHLYFLSDEYKKRIETLAAGININNVRMSHITDAPFPLPPLEEQEQIIEHLQTCTQKIDLVLGKLEDFLAESTSRTEALLSAAVGGYLTEDWREERKIPRDSWKLTTLGDAFKWSSGGTPSRKNPHYYVGTIPWVKSGELNDSLVTETEEHICELAIKESSAKVFPAGSVAIAMYGATIGKVGTLGMNAATNQAVAVAQTAEHTHTRYLLFFLRANRNRFISLGKGGAQPNISQQIIKAFPYQIPSLLEQAEIIRLVDLYLDRLSQAETLIAETVASLKRGKNGLVAAAMAGRFTSKPE